MRISVLLLIPISLVSSSSLYLLPLAYSQEFYYISSWGKFGTRMGELSGPAAIAVDSSSGNVYVADTANNRIQVFSSNGTFISKWGEYGPPIRNGTLRSPEGIAVDSSSGNVYVADTDNNRIQVFSSNGTFISRWGEYGGGNGMLRSPEGIAVDQGGNVYVADTANNMVTKFSSNGTFISKWGGYGTTNGTLRSPEGIAVDSSSGNVYVADTANNRIQVFSSNGTFISKSAKDLGSRYAIPLRSPEGIAVDSSSGNVYVADTANNRISAFTSRSPITNVAFSGEEGEIYGNDTRIKIETIYDGLKFPTAIAFLGPDDMLVLQRSDDTIMRIANGQMLDEPVLDLGNTTKVRGCMCGIAILHNDNGTSYAFLYYSHGEVTEDDGKTKLVDHLYRYDVTNGKLTNPKLLLEVPSSSVSVHDGGKVMVGPDNNIYLTTGEIDGRKTKAQNVKNGSLPDGSSGILRFTPNGDPVDGGLLGDTSPLDKYYAYGVRNSFGLNYDPITGNIWMTDNGPTFGDELNLVRPGFNGGYDKVMGLSSIFHKPFNLTDLEFFNGTGKYYDPIFDWGITVGVTDLVFVPSDKLGEEYEGNLFVGEINSGYLYRFLLNQSRTGLLLNGSLSDGVANNNVEKLQVAFAKINGGGITDLEIGPDGLLYLVSSNGKIMRLEPIEGNATLPVIETNVTDTNGTDTGGNATGTTGATGAGDATTTGVSIVLSSSTLTTDAYDPNPIQVSVGDTVIWTNDDSTIHTVTSGENGQPDGLFDSSIMAPQQTFEHTFTEGAGEYPYFCVLHPNMVGTVSVMS
jgi:glucose/arabinose dehydrogenase/plastocyanin